MEQETKKLRSELEKHNRQYYVLDGPSISGFEYDALMRRLRELDAFDTRVRESVGEVEYLLEPKVDDKCISVDYISYLLAKPKKQRNRPLYSFI